MYFLSLREVRLRTESGSHDMIMPARKATIVLPMLHAAAFAAGCVACDEKGKIIDDPELVIAPAEPAVSREEQIQSAVEEVIAKGEPSAFNSVTGKPKVGAVNKITGLKVSTVELEAAYNAVTEKQAAVNSDGEADGLEADV